MFLAQLSKLVNIIKEFDIPSYLSSNSTGGCSANKSTNPMTLNPKTNINTETIINLHDTSTNKNISEPKSILNTDDRDEIALTIMNLMDSYIEKSPLEVSSYHFDNNIKDYVVCNLFISLKEFYDHDILEDILNDIYEKTCSIYFSKYYPKRSYNNTFIRKLPNIEKRKQKNGIYFGII